MAVKIGPRGSNVSIRRWAIKALNSLFGPPKRQGVQGSMEGQPGTPVNAHQHQREESEVLNERTH